MSKIVIDVGFANLVVEQIDNCAIYPEVCATLEDKETNALIQDLVMVRPAVDERKGAMIPNAVDCFVWTDCDNEDYTDRFLIQKREAEQ